MVKVILDNKDFNVIVSWVLFIFNEIFLNQLFIKIIKINAVNYKNH